MSWITRLAGYCSIAVLFFWPEALDPSPFLYTRTSNAKEYQSISGAVAEAAIRKEVNALDERTGRKIVESLPANYVTDVLRHLMELNQGEIDIDQCLKTRQAAAEAVVQACAELWTTFVKSTGYSP